nr:unnamed protein product [Callosobruchus chinensis]
MGFKKAVQILKQADELKAKLTKKCDWLSSNDEWITLQQLQNFYYQLLVMDLEYALDKKVEQDLWTVGFRNVITSLQESACDNKNTSRGSYQALLMYSLESASGFFITLLQELCNAFDMDLPFRRRSSFYGQMIPSSEINMPHITSCLYICQYCLVHLGDIGRYRNQRKQAETFYKQAIQISPSSGHPYNQLALLEASQNNKLATVYYYIRSIAVKNPFPASCTNLSNTLNSAIDKDSFSEKCQTKITTNEFIHLFLCTHGYLHLHTELKQAETFIKRLNSIMTALVATQSFTGDMLVKIAAINMFAIKHVDDLTEDNPEKKRVRELVLELIAGFLCALLVPIHTLNVDEGLLDYYALPAVKIVLYYIQHNSNLLKERPFTQKLLIWPSLVKLVNGVQKYLKGTNLTKYTSCPLPEDKSLEGFLPLAKAFEEFSFSEVIKDLKVEKLLRLSRITNIAQWLTEVDVNGNKLIVRTQNNKEISFEPGLVQPDPTDTLLEEMKSLHIGNPESSAKTGVEKKSGILKPQGSLEKSREEKEIPIVSATDLNGAIGTNKIEKNRKGKQNIALQSIFKKMEETNKQVKFSVDEHEKDRIHASIQEQVHQPPPPIPIHTQPFGHRSSSFSLPLTEPDINFLKPFNKETVYSASENPILAPNVNVPPPVLPPYNKPQQQMYQQNNPPKGAYDTVSMPLPYQNVSYNYPFNIWRQEEPQSSLNVQQWWGNTRQQMPPNCRPPQNFPGFQQTPVNRVAGPPPNVMPQITNTQGSGDVFNMPWSYQNPHLRTYMGPEGTSTQNISVRQAMLKEGNLPMSSQPEDTMDRLNNLPAAEKNYVQNPINMPGYSLFNTNSWTPNLGGQLIGNKHPEDKGTHLNHHSLFRDHEPKSLAQLLEHQQNQNK